MAARAVRGLDVLYFILIFVWEEREVDADRNGASNFNVECGMSTALFFIVVWFVSASDDVAGRFAAAAAGHRCALRTK